MAAFDINNLPVNVKAIRLSNGIHAIVDSDWYEMLSVVRWHVLLPAYVRASGGHSGSLLHRVIMDAPKGMQVDHINGNPLDNRRCNLRLCNGSQNQSNLGKRKNNTSGFRGVCLKKKKWVATFIFEGKKVYIGSFDSALEAAMAYNSKVIQFHGEFARLNEIPQQIQTEE